VSCAIARRAPAKRTETTNKLMTDTCFNGG
jgi:hypothetical protein